MKTIYSLTIAWADGDPEQGEFGATVRATSIDEAERLVRELMRASHEENYGTDGDEYVQSDGRFGGRVIEACEGAIWKARELEGALRAVVATELFFGDHPQRQAAYARAREVLAEIDAYPADDGAKASQ